LENIQFSINVDFWHRFFSGAARKNPTKRKPQFFEVTFADFATDNSAVDGWTPGGRESGWFLLSSHAVKKFHELQDELKGIPSSVY